MLKKRTTGRGPSGATRAPTGPLDSWVSCDSHFVPAQAAAAELLAAPRTQPAQAAPSPGFGRLAPAERPGPSRSGSSTGSTLHRAQLLAAGGELAAGPPSTAASESSSQRGATWLRPWLRPTKGSQASTGAVPVAARDPCCHVGTTAATAIAAATSGGRSSGGAGGASCRTSAGGSSPTGAGLPETPCLRSPERSPTRRSRSSGSVPPPPPPLSPPPLPPAAAAAPGQPPMGHVSDRQPRARQQLPYAYCDGDNVTDTGGDRGCCSQVVSELDDEDWRQLQHQPAGRGCGDGRGSSSGGAGVSGAYMQPAPQAPVAPSRTAIAATVAIADPRDASMLLGLLAAVRCAAAAVRGTDVATLGRQVTAAAGDHHLHDHHRDGNGGGRRHDNDNDGCWAGNNDNGNNSRPGSRSIHIGSSAGGCPPTAAAPRVPTPPSAPAANGIDGAAATDATLLAGAVATPTGVLLLVLAVRLLRAAVRWPAATFLCAVAAAVLAWWLAAAAALLACVRVTGRLAHLVGGAAWAMTRWRLGSSRARRGGRQ